MAMVDGAALVYLTARRQETADDVCWELGAIGPTGGCCTTRAS
jgi:hypothetical protein